MDENTKLIINDNDPFNLQLFCELTKTSYGCFDLDNIFAVFKSINNILYLVYSTKKRYIICFDLDKFKKITEIRNHHKLHITNIRHYQDKINKLDLIISITDRDNNLRLWNFNDWSCILNIPHVNINGYLCSACIIKENCQNYILTTNYDMFDNFKNSEPIKVFNFKGEKVKEINNSNNMTFFIDTFYDNNKSKNYIITGNLGFIKSYDYDKNEDYHIYCDNKEFNNKGSHTSIIVNNDQGIIKLIESCSDGNIRVWNFNSSELLKKIKVFHDWLFGICLWNNDYIFAGCKDTKIILVDIKIGYIAKYLEGPKSGIFTIKKIYHSKYGECLISQGYDMDQIKLYVNKNIFNQK